jgi:hypothetical protein
LFGFNSKLFVQEGLLRKSVRERVSVRKKDDNWLKNAYIVEFNKNEYENIYYICGLLDE